LYDDSTATVISRQTTLFDPNDVTAGDSHLTCGRPMVRTESGYLCCPAGHGRLIDEGIPEPDQDDDLAASLSAAGADLTVIQENVNTRSPMGRFVFILFSALAELEREQVAERTSAAMLRHQAKGRRMTRPDRCPYGWRPDPSDPDRLVQDPEEQVTIRRIRHERRTGRGLREITHRLDTAGIACRGGPWSHTTIRSILLRSAELAESA
jgi:hypothetical protein